MHVTTTEHRQVRKRKERKMETKLNKQKKLTSTIQTLVKTMAACLLFAAVVHVEPAHGVEGIYAEPDNPLVSNGIYGTLLVRCHNGSDWDLHLIKADGTHIRAIDTTAFTIDMHGAEFSPDGQSILYVRSSGLTYEIVLAPFDGGPSTVLMSMTGAPYATSALWGSSCDYFYYALYTGGYCGSRDVEIHRRAVDGSFDEIVVAGKNLWPCDIDEQLNRSLYLENVPVGCSAPYGAIITRDADGANRHVLPLTDDGRCDSHGALCPAGQYILYNKSDGSGGWMPPMNMYLTDYEGTAEVRLTDYVGSGAARAPVWLDTERFVYSYSPTDSYSDEVLRYYEIATGVDTEVRCEMSNCQPLDFLPGPGPQEPDIEVSPLTFDYGEVEIGSSETMITTITNVGSEDLVVHDILLVSHTTAFAITSVPTLSVTIAPTGSVDVELTFTPDQTGDAFAILQIVSDDPDEGLVEATFGATGVVTEVPPLEQIAEVLDFIDAAVQEGTLTGQGSGRSAENKLNALINMIEATGDLIQDGLFLDAYEQLYAIYKKCDGQSPPPDFVVGESVLELAERIEILMDGLLPLLNPEDN